MPFLIGFALSVFLLLVSTAFYGPKILMAEVEKATEESGIALSPVADATARYIRNNQATLDAAVQIGGVNILTPDDLKPATVGGLDAGYVNSNRLGQTTKIYVLHVAPMKFRALVITCGGATPTDVMTIRSAGLITDGKARFGASTQIDAPGLVVGPNFQEPLAAYRVDPACAGPGHLAALVPLDGTQNSSTFLNRFPGAGGNVEENTLHSITYLDPTADIVLTGQIGSDGKPMRLSTSLSSELLAQNGDVIQKPQCPAPLTPLIVYGAKRITDDGTQNGVNGFNVQSLDNGPSWTIQISYIADDGTVRSSATGQALVVTKCTAS